MLTISPSMTSAVASPRFSPFPTSQSTAGASAKYRKAAMMNHQSRYQTLPSMVVAAHATSTSTMATVKACALQGDSGRLNHAPSGPLRAPGSSDWVWVSSGLDMAPHRPRR